ncbi:hydantoinase B/oxoprolinase family protein [Roseomonas sp. HJA6]|uniref:Hydantoinase B/oxoprolinase family protein n=1 Tax=Roseomonas alba TaxID=2846776 RepID=A0ABS7AAC6_9PROT|nr:hydantoinase B/oxoprolinase family protein [Neoroseomonas alba]MBW6399254.1 hydantoinase B/oxoprolinase family protein [Neoroseomonas alba]
MTEPTIDPFEFELFKNALLSVADEMALTVHRTTYSAVLRDNLDYSTAFFDAKGRLVAQGFSLPGHLGSMPTALAAIMRRFGDTMKPGDIFALNDPFDGGMHLPDLFVFQPIFIDGVLMAFAGSISHHTDMGGRVAGSNAADSTEIYQEGIRVPVLRIFDGGVPNDTFFAFIEKNVRVPAKVAGDIRAQLAACHIADAAFRELCAQYGPPKVERLMAELLDYSERLARAEIAKLPDGVFTFEDWLDDDGIERGKPVPIKVAIEKRGDSIRFDWTGSAPQVKGALNATLSFAKSVSYCALISIIDNAAPNNDGVFRAVEVVAPLGTIVNCTLPASVAARGLTGFRMIDVAFGALAKMVPDRVFACSDGGNSNISIGGYYADKTPYIYCDFTCAAWGARPWADGIDGNSNIFANMAGQSVEVTEAEQPVLIEDYEILADRGGAGKYRGGMPYRRTYRFLEEEASLSVRSDRRDIRPYGLYGGAPGAPSFNYITRAGGQQELYPSKFSTLLRRGDVFVHEIAGAGGWGDPLEREVARVMKDVRQGLVSVAAARDLYGVILSANGTSADEAATATQRATLRKARGWTEAPFVQREEIAPLAAAAE